MVAVRSDEERRAELQRRRAPFTKLIEEMTQGEPGMKQRLKEGSFFWAQTLLRLIPSEAKRFAECMATLGGERLELFVLCSQVTMAPLGGTVQAMWEAANIIQPGSCELRPNGTLMWKRLSVAGEPVCEIDFFLAHDLLDKEDDHG